MEENNILCQIYNKKYCLPVYSGTLAIEGLLKSLNLNKNTKVLISSISCYSILEAVLNASLTPIIATPKNGILFQLDELKTIIKQENIKIYIAVHQYGYYQEIPQINNLIIIEDLSQSWALKQSNNKNIQYKSDYLIQSLGPSKPLNNQIGGLIFSNKDISNNFDLKKKANRLCENKLLEYYYPLKINYKKLIAHANKKVAKQRYNAKKFYEIFKNKKLIAIFPTNNYLSSYHRYVIKVDKNLINQLVDILNKCEINYELEYKLKLNQLPIVNTYKIKTLNNNNLNNNYTFILLKTNNTFYKLTKLKKEMEHLL